MWPFLVGLWPVESSSTQRHALSEQLQADYERIRNGWINAVPELMDSEMKQSIKVRLSFECIKSDCYNKMYFNKPKNPIIPREPHFWFGFFNELFYHLKNRDY